MSLQVLTDLKTVFKEDTDLELKTSKTSILHKGVSDQVAFDVTQTIIQTTPVLDHPSNDVLVRKTEEGEM